MHVRSFNPASGPRPVLDDWAKFRGSTSRRCFSGVCSKPHLTPPELTRSNTALASALRSCKAPRHTQLQALQTGPSAGSAPNASPCSPEAEKEAAAESGRGWAPLNGLTAVIAGAGPAGCTLAMHLARAGWRVRVFEKRPEPGPATVSRQRSWVLAMYPRGIRPVSAVAEVPLLAERSYKGLVVGAGKQGAGEGGGKPIVLERTGVLMDRTLLATSLLDAARGQYGSRVEFRFDSPLQSVDFEGRAATFTRTSVTTSAASAAAAAPAAPAAPATAVSSTQRATAAFGAGDQQRELVGASAATATASSAAAFPLDSAAPSPPASAGSAAVPGRGGEASAASHEPKARGGGDETVEIVSYDLLVGADGSSSTLRSLLAEAFPGQYDTKVLGSPGGAAGVSCYKSVYGLPPVPEVEAWAPDSAVPVQERLQGEFFLVLSGLGGKGFLSMCRDIDGSYCGYLAAKQEVFEEAKSPEGYLALLPQVGPQLPAQWLPLLATKLAEAPLSSFPVMRALLRFWSPGGVVLVGDAAHTVTPALGQGLNSALEDCELLAGELRGAVGAGAEAEASAASFIDAALRRFSESRVPQVAALQELELLQSSSLTPLSAAPREPLPLLQLLVRKWVVLHYSGLALLGTIAATARAANRKKQQQQQQQQQEKVRPASHETQPAGTDAVGISRGGGDVSAAAEAAAAAEAEARADLLGSQLDATYVRSPPMYELLRGHMSYQDMLARVYGMAALGTGVTVALGYGMFAAVGALAARFLAG